MELMGVRSYNCNPGLHWVLSVALLIVLFIHCALHDVCAASVVMYMFS